MKQWHPKSLHGELSMFARYLAAFPPAKRVEMARGVIAECYSRWDEAQAGKRISCDLASVVMSRLARMQEVPCHLWDRDGLNAYEAALIALGDVARNIEADAEVAA